MSSIGQLRTKEVQTVVKRSTARNGTTLDEPAQLLSIIFDASSSWWTQFLPHIPQHSQQHAIPILTQLYHDFVGQLCAFINSYMALNKRNILQLIVMTDTTSIVIAPQLNYTFVQAVENNTDSNNNNNNNAAEEMNDNGNNNDNTNSILANDILLPTPIWVDPNRLPQPAKSNDELFGTTAAHIYSKLLVLNPIQAFTLGNGNNNNTTTANNNNDSAQLSPRSPLSNNTQHNSDIPNPASAGTLDAISRIVTGAMTKALCFINKAKKYDQALSSRILVFSFSAFQGSAAYMNCALFAAQLNTMIDTLCINHCPTRDDLQQESLQHDPTLRLSSLLAPLLVKHNVLIDENTKPLAKAFDSCHCEPHQQSSHITGGTSLSISQTDMSLIILWYTTLYNRDVVQQTPLQNNKGLDDQNYKQPLLYLFSLLQTHALTSSSIRSHLITPTQTHVTLTAPCFCHPNRPLTTSTTGTNQQQYVPQERYICNVCLVVVCEQHPRCPNCKSRFIIQKKVLDILEARKRKELQQQQQQQQQNIQQQQQQNIQQQQQHVQPLHPQHALNPAHHNNNQNIAAQQQQQPPKPAVNARPKINMGLKR